MRTWVPVFMGFVLFSIFAVAEADLSADCWCTSLWPDRRVTENGSSTEPFQSSCGVNREIQDQDCTASAYCRQCNSQPPGYMCTPDCTIMGVHYLGLAGFPRQIRLSNLQFTSPDSLVYSLYELDDQGFITGHQAYQSNLSAGTSRLLYHYQGAAGSIWEAHYDPVGDRFRLIDTLGPGKAGMRYLPHRPLEPARRRIE